MDRHQADTFLHQWAVWSLDAFRELEYKPARWQRDMDAGYAEESRSVQPGPDSVMMLVDAAVTRVSHQSPAMGLVLRNRYLRNRHVQYEDLNSALLRFVSAWLEIVPEVA